MVFSLEEIYSVAVNKLIIYTYIYISTHINFVDEVNKKRKLEGGKNHNLRKNFASVGKKLCIKCTILKHEMVKISYILRENHVHQTQGSKLEASS